jgi:hypothetical protein
VKRKAWIWWTAEEIASWPVNSKKCRGCYKVKTARSFHRLKQGYLGLANDCKNCRKKESKRHYHSRTLEQLILDRVKTRATKKGLPFSLKLEDIKIPAFCPILGVSLVKGSHQHAPSIDRLDPAKGYIEGNVNIISNRANMIKNAASLEELELVVKWLKLQL